MLPLGTPIPDQTPHAVSVSIPTWRENILYEEGDVSVIKMLRAGYPRFVFHPFVQKLFDFIKSKYLPENGSDHADLSDCLVFTNRTAARLCQNYLFAKTCDVNANPVSSKPCSTQTSCVICIHVDERLTLYITCFPPTYFPLAKQFWQHAGEGISSRAAEYALRVLSENRCWLTEEEESAAYLEERFGRNMDISLGAEAKSELRKRLARAFFPYEGEHRSSDVYLFPTGMAAIFTAYRVLRRRATLSDLFSKSSPRPKMFCQFGFPYTDTLKILQRFSMSGDDMIFYEKGDLEDLTSLSEVLRETANANHFAGLFCEFPSNPLLLCPHLESLYKLGNEYSFPIVVDDTIGNPYNLELIHSCDIVVSSLTKIFSGASNVMGGCLILNPDGQHYKQLKFILEDLFEDNYWYEDAIFLERNSRDFAHRIKNINYNAEALCDFLVTHPKGLNIKKDDLILVVDKVFYPKYVRRELYEKFRSKASQVGEDETKSGCFGGLFSFVFKRNEDAIAFFDDVRIYKGPSLGTNFTLACPYTILAHYNELEFAEKCGVSRYLIRVSVGLEDVQALLSLFSDALK